MSEIQNTKMIKAHSIDDFEHDVMNCTRSWQSNFWSVEVQYQPMMQLNGKPLYTALMVARG